MPSLSNSCVAVATSLGRTSMSSLVAVGKCLQNQDRLFNSQQDPELHTVVHFTKDNQRKRDYLSEPF